MSAVQTTKMSSWRWVICALLFLATTVNYMDRQVLSLTWKDFIAPEFHWNDNDYGTITGWFSIFYAIANLFAGKFIDWMGTKKGYLIAIFVWSTGAVLHAGCGWVAMNIEGYHSIAELGQLTGDAAVALATISVWLFLSCRLILALGEAGNFPAAIKVTAEYFPKKDRAFATWEMAFIIIGALGYVWMALWVWAYDKPHKNKRVNQAELNYIEQDVDIAEVQNKQEAKEEKTIPFWQCFTYKQTWSFIVGKFMTDGVWWFFLFWAPAYFSDQYGYTSDSAMGISLIFVLYAICTILSFGGGYLPKIFVEKYGMNPYAGRMRAMLIFAFFPLLGLLAQPLGVYSAWWPAILIGLLGAGHQSWSANIFSTVGDMFPKSTIGTITGIGSMAGGVGSFLINKGSGMFFTWADELSIDKVGAENAFQFFGFDGKPAAYMVVFCICAVAYLIGWCIMKVLVPKYKPIVLE